MTLGARLWGDAPTHGGVVAELSELLQELPFVAGHLDLPQEVVVVSAAALPWDLVEVLSGSIVWVAWADIQILSVALVTEKEDK